MPLAGPRLDRPTAIGDEGRPRATSLTFASVTLVALFAAVGWTLGDAAIVLSVGLLVGLVAAGMALSDRTGLGEQFVGHLCLLGGGSLLTFVLVTLSASSAIGLTIAGFTVAMTAMALTWANVADADGIQHGLEAVAYAFAALVGWFIVAALVVFAITFLWAILTEPVLSSDPTLALTVFGLAVTGAAVTVQVALSQLPLRQLVARSRRWRMDARIERWRSTTDRLAIAGLAWAIGVLVLAATRILEALFDVLPPLETMAAITGTPFFLGVPVLVATIALVATLVASTVRGVTDRLDQAREHVVAAAGAGLAMLLLLPFLLAGLPSLFLVDPGNLAVLLVMGPLGLLVLLALVLVAMAMGIVPDRAGGPAMAAGAMVVATIGTGLLDLPTPLVLGTAAGAIVVWDVSTFGLGVTAELGHQPETRRLELFHGVLAVGVGSVAVFVLSGVDVLRRSVSLATGGQLAASLAVAAALVAIAVLRR